jgi:hypothetical protein
MFKILKYSSPDSTLPDIKPIKRFVPEWYKNLTSYNEKNVFFENDGSLRKNVKNCMPFLDSLISGYVIELWADLYVEKNSQGQIIKWQNAAGAPPVGQRGDMSIAVPEGHNNTNFVWQIPYSLQTPKGYSVLITHPLNRFDLPFTSLSGIIDADVILTPGKYPFFLKESFSGIIEAGTPILQIIPFKHDDWKIEYDNTLSKKSEQVRSKFSRKFYNSYKDNFWRKKRYE